MKLEVQPVEAEIQQLGAEFTPLGLKLPKYLSELEWVRIGRRLELVDQSLEWCEADWAAFGLAHYDNGRTKLRALAEFAKNGRKEYQTLANAAWVARKVPFSRRREKLSFSIHETVAALSAAEQRRWLKEAEEKRLPRAALRRAIRLSQGENNALASDGPAIESPRRFLDGLLRWIREHPDPAGPDLSKFWTEERRSAWKEWLAPLMEFAARL